MITPETLLALIAIFFSIFSLVVVLFFWGRLKESTLEKEVVIERLLSSTKQKTFQSIAQLFEKRKNTFEQAKKDLKRTFGEPWLDELSEIVAMKRKKKEG